MYLGVFSRTKPVIYYLRSQDLSHILGSPRFSLLLCKMVTSSPHSSLQGLQGCDRFEWFGRLQCLERTCVTLGRKIRVYARFILLFNFIHFCDRIFGSGDAEKEKEGLLKFLFFMKKKLYFFTFDFDIEFYWTFARLVQRITKYPSPQFPRMPTSYLLDPFVCVIYWHFVFQSLQTKAPLLLDTK